MSEEKKVYPQVEELGLGKHIITGIKPFPEFKKEEKDGVMKNIPVEGSHKHGQKGDFKWWMYSFKNKEDKYVTLFGNDKNKAFLDSGTVEVAILHKSVNNEPAYKVVDGQPVPILISFVNEAPQVAVATPTPITDIVENAGTPEAKAEVAEAVTPTEEDTTVGDLPF